MKIWWLSFLAYLSFGAAWALAVPPNGHTDEHAHAIRAYAVADGQILGPRSVSWHGFGGSEFRVPANLMPPNDDCLYNPRQAASCLLPPASSKVETQSTWVGRYSPVYYAIAGPFLRLGGLYPARLATALLVALLLACAMALASSTAIRFGVVLAATPTVVGLSGALNPNAVEAAAAILVWVCLMATVESRWVVAALAAGGAVLVTVRTLGPLWIFLFVVCAVLLKRWRRLIDRRILAAWGAALAFALVWGAISGAAEHRQADEPFTGSVRYAAQIVVESRLDDWLRQLVAVFGYTETYPPLLLTVVWIGLIVAVLARSAAHPAVWLLALCLPGILTVLELSHLWRLGFVQNGRYALPVLAGLVIVAAARYAAQPGLLRWGTAVAAGLQLWALADVMSRFQAGPDAVLDPFTGTWSGPAGSAIPIALGCAAAITVAVAACDTTAFQPSTASATEPATPSISGAKVP